MILNMRNLLRKYNVTTLRELSKELQISLDKIKNISSGRTASSALYKKRIQYSVFPKQSEELSELIGTVLGDGNIFKFNRCQRLTISCNSFYKDYVEHIRHLVKHVFKKGPSVIKRSKVNCCDVSLYMQNIDKALGLPAGNKIKNKVKIPAWIFKHKKYLKKCLKGLFETDGDYGLNKKFHVEYMEFSNKSVSLRRSVFEALTSLGYSPQDGNRYVRLAKKDQVRKFIAEMDFKRPFPSLKNNEA